MEKAAFYIQSYQFDKVSINLDNHISNEMLLEFKTSGCFNKSESNYKLEFIVKSFNEGLIDKPFIEVHCKGIFKFDNVSELKDIPAFFYKNSIAILFPYLRAYVSIITTQANVPGIIIPTLNLSSLEGELKQNTIEE